MKETVLEKLKVLAESAKYDVSCASSGVTRKHRAGGVGSAAGWGICTPSRPTDAASRC